MTQYAWHMGYPCPDDTDGDGDCWKCARYKDVHKHEAVTRLHDGAELMADALMELDRMGAIPPSTVAASLMPTLKAIAHPTKLQRMGKA